MKNILLLLLLLPVLAFGQYDKYETKRIEVWGEAEKIVIPNEFYTSITIKEYKAPGKKVSLDDLEKQLVKAVASEDIPKENLRVENIYGYNWDWQKKKTDEFLASKTFELKTSDVKKLNDLLARLDPEGLFSVNIKRFTHTELDRIKQELQLEALKNAKAKAQTLANGIGEVIGGVLEIQEVQQPNYYQESMAMNIRGKGMEDSYESNVDFRNMKITSNIRAVFEIN